MAYRRKANKFAVINITLYFRLNSNAFVLYIAISANNNNNLGGVMLTLNRLQNRY